MPERITLLDACSVVGLFATRRMEEIVAAVPGPVAVVGIVASESQYVFRGGGEADAREREPIDFQSMTGRGAFSIIANGTEEELQTFIDLTKELQDGEAMTAALAIHRNCTVVTDDRKAERILTAHGVQVRCTLDLIKTWVDREQLPLEEIRRIFIDLRLRASYEPGRNHPFRPWWDSILLG